MSAGVDVHKDVLESESGIVDTVEHNESFSPEPHCVQALYTGFMGNFNFFGGSGKT